MGEMSEDEVREKLQALFDKFDADGDGLITAEDLKTLFADAGAELTDEQADALIAKNDPDGTGSVDFDRFALSIVGDQIKRKIMILYAIFRELDVDNTGYISAENLKELAARDGGDVDEEAIDNLVAAADQTGDGQISFKEFIAALIGILKEKFGEGDE